MSGRMKAGLLGERRHSLSMGANEGPLLVALGPSFKTGKERVVAGRFRISTAGHTRISRLVRRCGMIQREL
jgi:hypothetical protein